MSDLIQYQSYQEIKTILVTFESCALLLFFCLGDIGGQVGLFLGASILTVLEFGDLVARIIVNKIKQRKRRRTRAV